MPQLASQSQITLPVEALGRQGAQLLRYIVTSVLPLLLEASQHLLNLQKFLWRELDHQTLLDQKDQNIPAGQKLPLGSKCLFLFPTLGSIRFNQGIGNAPALARLCQGRRAEVASARCAERHARARDIMNHRIPEVNIGAKTDFDVQLAEELERGYSVPKESFS